MLIQSRTSSMALWSCYGCLIASVLVLYLHCEQVGAAAITSSEEDLDTIPFFSFLFGNNDVDRRSDLRSSTLGNEFLGKRSAGAPPLAKRRPGSEFLGKRVPGSEFLGKRVPGSEFLGKRVPGSEFLGKRNYDLGAADARALRHLMSPTAWKRSPEEASEFGRGDRDLHWSRIQEQLGR